MSNETAVERNRTSCLNDRTQQLHAKTSYLNDILQTTKHNNIRLDQERNQVNGLTIEGKRLKDNEQVTQYDLSKATSTKEAVHNEIMSVKWELSDLEIRYENKQREEADILHQHRATQDSLGSRRKDHANSTAQRNIVGTNLRQHEEEGKDKRNDFNRTLDLCTELNNIIDQEIQRRDLLMTQIKALESERVVLLKNTDRYTQEEIDLHKHIQNCNK